jgi:hypothetical protein
VPVDTVKTRLARGLDALRKRFDREHGGDRGAWLAAFAPLAFGPLSGSATPPVTGDPSPASPLVVTTLIPLAMDAKLKVAAVLALVACGSGLWLATQGGDVMPAAAGVEPPPALTLAEPEHGTAPSALGGSFAARAPVAEDADPPVASIDATVVERHGTVVDLEKRPVAGLAILDGWGRQPIVVDGRPVTSDARGRFAVRERVGLGA